MQRVGGTTAWWQSKCWPVLLSWCALARAWRRSSWYARCDSRKACSPALRSARATCWSRRTRSQLSSSSRAQVECAGCAEHSPWFCWWFWALASYSFRLVALLFFAHPRSIARSLPSAPPTPPPTAQAASGTRGQSTAPRARNKQSRHGRQAGTGRQAGRQAGSRHAGVI